MSTDRRAFLKLLGGSALAGAVLPAIPAVGEAAVAGRTAGTLAIGPDRSGVSGSGVSGSGVSGSGVSRGWMAGEPLPRDHADEAYWEAVQRRFPLGGTIPLNAANLGPSPAAVTALAYAARHSIDSDPSFQNREAYERRRETVRAGLAAFLGAAPDEIAMVRNTTEGNNIVAAGIELGPGDEVVLHEENHPSNSVAWDVRAARRGFTVKRVGVTPRMSHGEMLTTFAAALTPRTRVLSFTDVSNTTGIRLPVRELCAVARERGIHVHIDGAQSFGVLELDLHALGCDSYSASCHKWFMGPKETGVLYVRAERAPAIWPGSVGLGWGGDATPGPSAARRFETLGQRDDAAVEGIAVVLDLYREIGAAAVERRVLELAAWLKDELAAMPGASIITPRDAERSAGVVIVAFEGRDTRQLYERLYSEHRISAAPTGGLRLCPHIYTVKHDLERTVAAVRALL
jgi:isopenicillin-N epimerase